MICVNSAEDVEALLSGPDGPLAAPAPGLMIVDHTTGSPQMVNKLDRLVRAAGGRYAEAPMTRTPKHADVGKVNVLFGGASGLPDIGAVLTRQDISTIVQCGLSRRASTGPT